MPTEITIPRCVRRIQMHGGTVLLPVGHILGFASVNSATGEMFSSRSPSPEHRGHEPHFMSANSSVFVFSTTQYKIRVVTALVYKQGNMSQWSMSGHVSSSAFIASSINEDLELSILRRLTFRCRYAHLLPISFRPCRWLPHLTGLILETVIVRFFIYCSLIVYRIFGIMMKSS